MFILLKQKKNENAHKKKKTTYPLLFTKILNNKNNASNAHKKNRNHQTCLTFSTNTGLSGLHWFWDLLLGCCSPLFLKSDRKFNTTNL